MSKLGKKTTLDTIIRVDRTRDMSLGGLILLHPELQTIGPAEYDLANVELYLHNQQKNPGYMNGYNLYEHLKETDSLKDCLSLDDAEEIKNKGADFFREFFGRHAQIFCWKSIVRFPVPDCRYVVPMICDHGHNIVVSQRGVGNNWQRNDPAARFPAS